MNTEELERLKVVCIKIATGKADPQDDFNLYSALRRELLTDSKLSSHIPASIRDSLDGGSLFGYFQALYPTYQERRVAINKTFVPLEKITREKETTYLLTTDLENNIGSVDSTFVRENFRKMIERADSDPSGCITSARGLLESTLKYILNQSGIEVEKNPDIGKLLNKVKQVLFPNFPKETEEIKKIIGSLSLVVDKIKLIRDSYGDAHGHLDGDGSLDSVFAVFIANMSASICSFLIAAHEFYKKSGLEPSQCLEK